jgi:hypothetical protein
MTETTTDTKAMAYAAIAAARDAGGYLTLDQVKAIGAEGTTRLSILLVRCGCGRFLAPAQDVQHFIDIINAHGEAKLPDADYVRDVSLPAGFTVRGN